MKRKEHFEFSMGVIAYPVFFVLVIWLVFAIEIRFGYNFSKYGVFPQTLKGLRGVLLSPFIHGDIKHIYHNTVPLFVLSTALFYFYRHIAWKIMLYGILLSVITGLLFAFIFRKEIAKPKKYVWEQDHFNEDNDPFLKHFDEDGNFIETVEPEIEEEQLYINYHFKKEDNKID